LIYKLIQYARVTDYLGIFALIGNDAE